MWVASHLRPSSAAFITIIAESSFRHGQGTNVETSAPPLIAVAYGALALMVPTGGAGSSQRAGAESSDDIVALWREEVPVARARDARTGGPAPSAQHLARVEPRP